MSWHASSRHAALNGRKWRRVLTQRGRDADGRGSGMRSYAVALSKDARFGAMSGVVDHEACLGKPSKSRSPKGMECGVWFQHGRPSAGTLALEQRSAWDRPSRVSWTTPCGELHMEICLNLRARRVRSVRLLHGIAPRSRGVILIGARTRVSRCVDDRRVWWRRRGSRAQSHGARRRCLKKCHKVLAQRVRSVRLHHG